MEEKYVNLDTLKEVLERIANLYQTLASAIEELSERISVLEALNE